MDGEHHVVTIEGPLTAEAIVDAHLAARATGKPLRIEHRGAPSPVAIRTAERFGATLVDTTPAPKAPSLLDEGSPELPWDRAPKPPETGPTLTIPEDEFEAMPWNVVDNVLMPAGRHTRAGPAFRPSQTPDWGLPWPRPMAPMDGLSKADPALWGSQDRIRAIRDDLERAGAPSFGATKPEGSAWLKRLSEFGPP